MHYFCLLLSSGLTQAGNQSKCQNFTIDKYYVYGFYLKDIFQGTILFNFNNYHLVHKDKSLYNSLLFFCIEIESVHLAFGLKQNKVFYLDHLQLLLYFPKL